MFLSYPPPISPNIFKPHIAEKALILLECFTLFKLVFVEIIRLCSWERWNPGYPRIPTINLIFFCFNLIITHSLFPFLPLLSHTHTLHICRPLGFAQMFYLWSVIYVTDLFLFVHILRWVYFVTPKKCIQVLAHTYAQHSHTPINEYFVPGNISYSIHNDLIYTKKPNSSMTTLSLSLSTHFEWWLIP